MNIRIVNNVFLRVSESDLAKLDIWFIHGFGGSGQIFHEAFQSPLISGNNLYIPDLPGCGATPPLSKPMKIQDITDLLANLIKETSYNRPIAIIAHSLGGVIGTWLSERLSRQVKVYINVEGNLTEADAYFCGIANHYESAVDFHNAYKQKVFEMLNDSEPALHRHYASMNFADPVALSILGKSGDSATGEKKSGAEFLSLKCDKVYYWAEKSTPRQTKDFIKTMNVPNRCLDDCGHWPMIDKPDEFYQTVFKDLEKTI